MALIDRGRVMIDYLEILGTMDSYKAKYEALCKAVDDAPAVDAAPVVHARYGFVGPHIGSLYASYGTCGNCKERILIDPQHKNFCPNCGAHMDEEE